MKERRNAPSLAVSGMLAALVALATMLFKLPLVAPPGYIHLGDTLILFSAMLAGSAAAPIGGIGSALADVLGGYGFYALPTLFIKALTGFLASKRLRLEGQHAFLHCALSFSAAELAMVVGYAIFESFAYSFATAVSGIPMNLLQAAASAALACALLPVARRIRPTLRSGGKPL